MQQLEAQSVRQAVRIPRGLRTTGRTLKTGLALREGRRNANRGTRLRLLRCECDQPGCKAQLPSSAERYRRSGIGERFLVVPRHIPGSFAAWRTGVPPDALMMKNSDIGLS